MARPAARSKSPAASPVTKKSSTASVTRRKSTRASPKPTVSSNGHPPTRRPPMVESSDSDSEDDDEEEEEEEVQSKKDGPHIDRGLQTKILLFLILPWVLYVAVFGLQETIGELRDGLRLDAARAWFGKWQHPTSLLLITVALSAPHVLYAFCWTHPVAWIAISEDWGLGYPVHSFAGTAKWLKVFQLFCLLCWIWGSTGFVSSERSAAWNALGQQLGSPYHGYGELPLACKVLAAQLILVGQLLNLAVYNAIGEGGVYYGVKWGVEVPWHYGFPFNVGVRDPQYTGAALSFFGLFILMITEDSAKSGVHFLFPVIAVYYFFSSFVEARL